MNSFFVYLKLGINHILDLNGFDHILFILTLCAVYPVKEWKRVALVITAFTLGHSITLALASLRIIFPNQYLVELLIPATILFSGCFNLYFSRLKDDSIRRNTKFVLGLFFGLIHGMGFSSFFSMLMGNSNRILFPLFSFNLGIEIGQLCVIAFYFFFVAVLNATTKVSHQLLARISSLTGIAVAIYLIITRI